MVWATDQYIRENGLVVHEYNACPFGDDPCTCADCVCCELDPTDPIHDTAAALERREREQAEATTLPMGLLEDRNVS